MENSRQQLPPAQAVRLEHFANRDGLCFYGCENHPLDRTPVSDLYKGWAESNFISLYATTEQFDDWADSVADYHHLASGK